MCKIEKISAVVAVHNEEKYPTVISRFIMSPFTGVFMAVKTGEPTVTYIHPLIRLYYLKGLLESKRFCSGVEARWSN